jgi:hypothetical protein
MNTEAAEVADALTVACGMTWLGALAVAGRISPWVESLGTPDCALGVDTDDGSVELELREVWIGAALAEVAPGAGSWLPPVGAQALNEIATSTWSHVLMRSTIKRP